MRNEILDELLRVGKVGSVKLVGIQVDDLGGELDDKLFQSPGNMILMPILKAALSVVISVVISHSSHANNDSESIAKLSAMDEIRFFKCFHLVVAFHVSESNMGGSLIFVLFSLFSMIPLGNAKKSYYRGVVFSLI
jgi:hypothetical protein